VGSSSPFTKGSPLYTMACHVCGGLLGVAGWNMADQIGLARCWVLRGHPVWVLSLAVLIMDRLTLAVGSCVLRVLVWVVVVGVVGCGCLLSVA
jgi:hypothetical protein